MKIFSVLLTLLLLCGSHLTAQNVPCPLPAFGTIEISPAFILDGQGQNVDTIDLWETADPDSILMFVTAKDNSLVEVWRYPFLNNELPPLIDSTFGTARVNGVIIDQETDLLYIAVAGSNPTVSVFTLPQLDFVMNFIKPGLTDIGIEPNLGLLKLPNGDKRIYVTSEDSVYIHDAVNGNYLGQFRPGTDIETVFCDSFYQALYIPDENGRTGVYAFHPDGTPYLRNGSNRFGHNNFQDDAEGIWIYTCQPPGMPDDGSGFIIVSDQVRTQSEFEFFDRETWDHLGTLKITGVNNTDGIRSFQHPLPDYPLGLFLVIDDDQTTVGVGWREIFQLMGLVNIENNPVVPQALVLQQNYPNPFNPETVIGYTLSVNRSVSLEIYNVLGEKIRRLVGEGANPAIRQGPGNYTVTWDGRDEAGRPTASGLYIYRIKAGAEVIQKKMILMR